MTPSAVFQFLQDRTEFGALGTFTAEVRNGPSATFGGGTIGRIFLTAVGILDVRAEIDGYYSPWLPVRVFKDEIVNFIILPPQSAWLRTLGLASKLDYLTLKEVSRVKV